MPSEISLKDIETLSTHFKGKIDKIQRNEFLKLYEITKDNPDISLEVLRDGETRIEFIKAFLHKENKDLFYLVFTQEGKDITAFPTTQIKKVINDIEKSNKVLKIAEASKVVTSTAEPISASINPTTLTLSDNPTPIPLKSQVEQMELKDISKITELDKFYPNAKK